jgi:3-deoxy-D-manno-octulosonic acid kinase
MTIESDSANCRIRQQRDIDWQFTEEHFELDFWRERPGFETTAGGRGGSGIIQIGGRRMLLRRYRRGGVLRRLFADRYLWLGQSLSRPWREWDVLLHARAAELPVPEPLAACTCRSGPWYRAALITAYLEGTEMLTQRLRRRQLPREGWYRLGTLVRRMHVTGIRHADLNADNVLLDDEDRFYLVDFDKARLMARIDDWQWRPLYRFQRSINKRNRLQALHFDDDDWQAFMDGYQSREHS